MEIVIADRKVIEKLNPEIPYIVIGSTDPHKSKPEIVKNKWYIADLRLYYLDILEEDALRYSPGSLFGLDQARLTINFYNRHKAKAELCICQCDGGVSRSSAMAAFFLSISGQNPAQIFCNERYAPNSHVYNLLHRVYRLEYV